MRKPTILKFIFFLTISAAFQIVLNEGWYYFFYKEKPNIVINNSGEYFEPSLTHLNSISQFIDHCDSVYGNRKIAKSDSEYYSTIVSITLRGRFYHGYSYYKLGQNFLAYVFAPFIHRDLSAIVIPDDILKHSNAACSQQSIVGMEVFKKKGFRVRKVGFLDKKYGGHFCFEVFYGNKWHYFDPDMEPELWTMIKLHHPAFEELNKNDSLLYKLYSGKNRDFVRHVFSNFFYGKVNKFPASNARIYQYVTKYLSYTLWFWLILLYFFVRKRLNIINKKKNETCAELQESLISEVKI
jgi:hypothetical protein